MTADVIRTLAATDFSPSSLAALDFAIVLARPQRAPALHVVHAIALPTVPMPPGEALYAEDFEQRARTALEKALHEVVAPRRGPVPIETHLVTGAPAPALIEEARALGCERIVVGATGRSILPRFLIGNVADRLVRTSPIPVVVVPQPSEEVPARTAIRNIVCAADFSAPSEHAVIAALHLAREHHARLHLVHAWHVAPYVERMPELSASIERDMARELDALAQRHASPDLTLVRHLRRGHPHHELVHAARELDADIIVVGTSGKTGLDRVLLGSVAERIIRTSPVPVLVATTRA